MARPPEITEQDIVSAGRHLEAAGERITPYRLYRAVGGRGRPDRLMKLWTAHVAGRASADVPEPPALAPAIRDGLATAVRMIGEQLERTVRQLSADLAADAAARTAAERDALTRERATLAETEADALAEFTTVVEELEQLRAETLRLAEDLRRSEVAREAAETVRQLAVEQLTAAHAARTEALLDAARVGERATAAERRITELEADLFAMRQAAADGSRRARSRAGQEETGGHAVGDARRNSSGPPRPMEAGRRGGRRSPAVGGEPSTEPAASPVAA
jgi:hypothetical protein